MNSTFFKEEIELPEVPKQSGHYLAVKRINNLLYVSGVTCKWNGKILYQGKVGKDLTIDEGYEAAKICGLNLLAIIQDYIGNLDKVKQIVKITGYVNCEDGFSKIPQIINGASDLFVNLYDEAGEHVRCAVGVASLPGNAAVEVDVIAELKDG
ncbi:RidA family protein [Aliibacillus thermotolerans]|uniref:RidA family protein n=1 Tax=Aliibacillus thermotolerans TaxID=1834418 RepID=A0ABW0U339_9BACI|nr:RidA family protein [Aliibacillus thermotolerans]MDA3129506.1 RidA family protein [Aliibacillus thermotolerans]